MDAKKLKPIPSQKTLLLVNNFIINTTRFLNHFSSSCESKLIQVSHSLVLKRRTFISIRAQLSALDDDFNDDDDDGGGGGGDDSSGFGFCTRRLLVGWVRSCYDTVS